MSAVEKSPPSAAALACRHASLIRLPMPGALAGATGSVAKSRSFTRVASVDGGTELATTGGVDRSLRVPIQTAPAPTRTITAATAPTIIRCAGRARGGGFAVVAG